MSDSEEEAPDRQLKLVIMGDGASGKVRFVITIIQAKSIPSPLFSQLPNSLIHLDPNRSLGPLTGSLQSMLHDHDCQDRAGVDRHNTFFAHTLSQLAYSRAEHNK